MGEGLWRRLFLAAAVLAGWWWLHSFWRQQISHFTGEAKWVWVTHELQRTYPTRAVFVAHFSLERVGPGALLKVCADREYVATVNGVVAACGWSRPGFRLDVFDVSHLLHPGRNSVRLEVRSPTPVGGLLASLDLPGGRRNAVVTGRHFLLLRRDGSLTPPPVVWGQPPRYPWGYPEVFPRPRTLDQTVVEEPIRLEVVSPLRGQLFLYRLARPVFGYVWVLPAGDGWTWVSLGREGEDLGELRERLVPFTGAPDPLLCPDPQWVSQVLVVARQRPLAVEVWPVPEAFRSRAPGAVPGRLGPVPRTHWRFRNPPE